MHNALLRTRVLLQGKPSHALVVRQHQEEIIACVHEAAAAEAELEEQQDEGGRVLSAAACSFENIAAALQALLGPDALPAGFMIMCCRLVESKQLY